MTPEEERQVVEDAAREILRYEDRDGGRYHGRSAVEVVEEALDDADLDEWCRLARRALRRARQLRGEEPRPKGCPPKTRRESEVPVFEERSGRFSPP